MKNIKKWLLAFFASALLINTWVYAAGIDHFEVEFTPNKAKVWESMDLTIEAVDKNNETILDYDGTILIFSESDPEAELPSALEENTYTFSVADQWKIKFENSVKFKSPGTQNIHIYDLNDDTVFGIAEAEITQKEVIKNIDISIVSPETGLTIWSNSISVSWTTQKNYQVKIIVNGSDEYNTTSNNDGIFEKAVEDLSDGDNVIEAQVIDADDNVVWESTKVNIRVDKSSLDIKSVKVTPESVEVENSYEVEVVSNQGLSEVNVIVDDVLTLLEETKPWVYAAKMTAPSTAGTFKVDVQIKDELWHEETELWAASITVTEAPELESAEEPEVIETATWEVEEPEEVDLTITWLKLVELKTKSILTWDAIEEAESYNVYKKVEDEMLELVQNVSEPKFEVEIEWDEIKYDYFAVKAVAKTASWEIYEWDLSAATKVKTWPELVILLILSLLIWGTFLYIQQKRA